MIQTNITTGAQTVTAVGAVTPTTGLDISPALLDYGFLIDIIELKAAALIPAARIVLEDSVDAFAAAIPVVEITIGGTVVPAARITLQWRAYQTPARVGIASAKIRANVVKLEGTTPSLTLRAALLS